MDGMRKSLIDEFSAIYILNLKGAIRGKTKEQSKIEGGNIFDIMTGVTIVILVKDTSKKQQGILHYLDIGDGLTKNEKLSKLVNHSSIINIEDEFREITPNNKNDWINKRNSNFDSLTEIGNKKSKNALLIDYTGGIKTGRDAWSWGFQKEKITAKIRESIEYYEENLGNIDVYSQTTNKISWTGSLKKQFEKGQKITYEEDRIFMGMYRPFTKKYVYYSKALVDRQYQIPKVFPNKNTKNSLIAISNRTHGKNFTSLFIDVLPDVNLFAGGSQNLPQLLYDNMGEYSAVRTDILKRFDDLPEEDLFYYIYGIFHSKDYEKFYHEDLSKSFPRLPNVSNQTDFIEIGKKLAYLHLNYEKIPAYEAVEIVYKTDNPSFKINKKMKHPKRGQLDTIIFNEDIVIKGIPEKAYEYIVNGKSAIEWIIDQYQIKDRESGIVDDPNEFSDNPKYIFNLLLSIINVSMQTIDLVESLPPLEIID